MVRRIVIGILVIGELGMKWIIARVGWVIPTTKGTRNDDHTFSRKGKIGLIAMILNGVYADTLHQNCLQCHQAQQIPSALTYRRYLMKYSTPERIETAMLAYLKDPKRADSIMPTQFFLKFPMKPPMQMNEREMVQNIRAYIEYFDVRKHLILETKTE